MSTLNAGALSMETFKKSNLAEYGNEQSIHPIFRTVELLEMILLKTDNKTVLLAHRTCKRFRNTIAGSKKLQKKLFFIRPTIEEAIQLSDNSNNLIILTGYTSTNQAYVLNTLVFDLALRWRNEHSSHASLHKEVSLPPGIARDMQRGSKGSWQRMWCTSVFAAPERSINEEFELTLEVKDLALAERLVGGGLEEYQQLLGEYYPGPSPYGWNMGAMGEVIRGVTADVQEYYRTDVDWPGSAFCLCAQVMTWDQWKGLSRIAAKEGQDCWQRLQCWVDRSRPPPEDVIDAELARYDALEREAEVRAAVEREFAEKTMAEAIEAAEEEYALMTLT